MQSYKVYKKVQSTKARSVVDPTNKDKIAINYENVQIKTDPKI